MSEELKKKVTKRNYDNISLSTKPYKHHRVGDFTCESEVLQDGKTICCLHNPKTGAWKWPVKGESD